MAQEPEHQRDVARLADLCRSIVDLLEWLSPAADSWLDYEPTRRSRRRRVVRERQNSRPSFTSELARVREAALSIIADMATIEKSGDPRLQQLHLAGLTRTSLDLKIRVLGAVARRFRVSPRRLLDWATSFLGSLGTVPAYSASCELVKEFTEMVQLTAWSIHRPPKTPDAILRLRDN